MMAEDFAEAFIANTENTCNVLYGHTSLQQTGFVWRQASKTYNAYKKICIICNNNMQKNMEK